MLFTKEGQSVTLKIAFQAAQKLRPGDEGVMRVILVGRDRETLEPLIDQLTREGFEVGLVDNSAGVLSLIKKESLHFLVAEPSLLLDHNLGREVLKRCPLARLVALDARPSLLGLADALAGGLTDYFPRQPEYFDEVVRTIVSESRRVARWRRLLLSGLAPGPGSEAG